MEFEEFLSRYRTKEMALLDQTKGCVMLTRSVLVDLPPQTSCQAHSLPRSNASKSGDLVEIRVDFFLLGFHTTLASYA